MHKGFERALAAIARLRERGVTYEKITLLLKSYESAIDYPGADVFFYDPLDTLTQAQRDAISREKLNVKS
ncbi:MAG TPA: hypothetical protein VK769_05380 [Verrucomicrobiae bacterium]|jgi:hypothetical protein|nr:hypothetical protein [Verrucomicrobiae bacterium]